MQQPVRSTGGIYYSYRLSFSLSVSIIPSRLQTKRNIQSVGKDTVTKLTLNMGSSHFTDITCPWGGTR